MRKDIFGDEDGDDDFQTSPSKAIAAAVSDFNKCNKSILPPSKSVLIPSPPSTEDVVPPQVLVAKVVEVNTPPKKTSEPLIFKGRREIRAFMRNLAPNKDFQEGFSNGNGVEFICGTASRDAFLTWRKNHSRSQEHWPRYVDKESNQKVDMCRFLVHFRKKIVDGEITWRVLRPEEDESSNWNHSAGCTCPFRLSQKEIMSNSGIINAILSCRTAKLAVDKVKRE